MDVVIFSRISSQSQDNLRQILNLKKIAADNGWNVKRVFQETVSGTVSTSVRKEFGKMMEYLEMHGIKLVMISEISRIGRRVIDILTTVDQFHKKGIGLFVQQFNMVSFQDGKENPTVIMLLQMLSIGAELENNLRRDRQREGIAIAKLRNKYNGRKAGSRGSREKMLQKYANIVELLKNSTLSIRRVAKHSGRSINTVRMVKRLLAA